MRILSFILLFLACINIGTSQSSDYCICDEAAPDLNYFIIEDFQDQEVASNLDNNFANINQGWTAPPSFFSSASSRTIVPTTYTDTPTEPTASKEETPNLDLDSGTSSIPEINPLPQEKETSPPSPAGASDSPKTQKQGGSASRKARTGNKSKALNPRIKRKKNQGRLKNKRGKKVKKYKGKCPHF